MLFHLTENQLLVSSGKEKVLTQGNYKVWFKGYFFIRNNYYSSLEAGKYLLDQFESTDFKKSVSNCNGVFTCIIGNSKTKEICICNDRFGFGQVFYKKTKNSLLISNDFWELVDKTNSYELNPQGIYEILRFRYIMGNETLVSGISCIESASVYTFKITDASIHENRTEYWFFELRPQSYTKEEAEIKIHKLLSKIINRYKKKLFDNKKIGVNLTGGLDSRYLLPLLLSSKVDARNIEAFTYGSEHCEDIKLSAKVANITGVKHNKVLFENDMSSIFDKDIIENIQKHIGFFTFYFQGYGISKILPHYKNIDYLLTGSDGFIIGLYAVEELFNIKSAEELKNYIFSKNSSILSPSECEIILQQDVSKWEKRINSKLADSLKNSVPFSSKFYDWTIKNRIRKYILSIHEILNSNCTALYPYYDYDFFDLMSELPFHILKNQSVYINAMHKYAFTEELKSVPVEFRGKAIKVNNDFILEGNRKSIIFKIIKKLFALPEVGYTYPIYKAYKSSRKLFKRNIYSLLNSSSGIMNSVEVIRLFNKKRRKEHFFRYGLLAIINIFQFEMLINKKSENSKKTNN